VEIVAQLDARDTPNDAADRPLLGSALHEFGQIHALVDGDLDRSTSTVRLDPQLRSEVPVDLGIAPLVRHADHVEANVVSSGARHGSCAANEASLSLW
jgi:hypothetical protein